MSLGGGPISGRPVRRQKPENPRRYDGPMRLPNAERAIIPIEKLTSYALNPDHPTGRHKARVFARALGITADDAELLRSALQRAAAEGDATLGEADEHGQRYQIDFAMTTDIGTETVRSAWIILAGDDVPRLLSCYII